MMKLNLKELRKKKNSTIVSSEQALKDVVKFNWTDEVLNGQKKVIAR
ncbi:hypothetical protein [Clostridium gasigenes]|nr:hypothetical protein [Clostridium gasigenes]MBU3105106.1 hypothetical protein [Clostridium gasigenes]